MSFSSPLSRPNPGKMPNHVAVIMDGNGRWASARGKPRVWGHHKGVKNVRTVVELAVKWGIKSLTLYAFSEENWGRPDHEIQSVFRLLSHYLQRNQSLLHKHKIRLRTLGRLDKLPLSLQTLLRQTETDTAGYAGLHLNLALSYGGRQDIADACQEMGKDLLEGHLKVGDIDEACVSRYLSTRALEDPDLLIRTGGELRVSNFLLYQIAYAELWFTHVLWPDFGEADFLEALRAFEHRQRRFGLCQDTGVLTEAEVEGLYAEIDGFSGGDVEGSYA